MSSRRIQGITVEINGDTTKLNSALKSVDKNLASTQSQLKDVEKLLKLDPKNTELLAQKQKLLTNAIGDTKDRLEKLKSAAAELAKKDSTPELQKQQDALQREIVETEGKLKSFEKELGNIPNKAKQAFDTIGDGLTKAGEKMTEVGTSLTKNVTAPIAAVGAASVAAFNEVDEAMDTVVKKTGATGTALQEMQGIVENLATTIPTDFQTAADAVGEINTRFGVTGDELEALSAQFIKFADLNNTDVSNSVDSVQKVMAAFNIDAKQASKVLDTLNKTGQKTGISVDRLAETMSTNAAALQEMGMNAAESADFLGQVEKSGADLSIVMRGLKVANANAAKSGKSMRDTLKDFQGVMDSTKSDTEKLQTAIELFGSNAGQAIYNACRTGSLSFEDMASSLEAFSGSVEESFNNTIDGVDNWTMAMNEVKLLGADIGGMLSEFAGPILKKVRDALKDAVQWWRGLSDQQKENILKITGIVAAIGPMVTIVGKATTAVGLLSKGLGVLAAHPVVAAIVGIGGALVGVGVAIDNHIKKVKEAEEEEAGWTEENKNLVQVINDQAEAYQESLKVKEETFGAMDAEYGHLQDLAEEYDSYLDTNGKVQKGYEDRAEFILTELSKALGVERDDIDKIIQKNGELSSSIDAIIEKRKAEAILNSLQSEYTEAILQAKDAEMNLASAQAARAKQEKLLNDVDAKRKALTEQINELTDDQGRALNGLEGSVQPLREELGELETQYANTKATLEVMDAAVKQAEDTYEGYQTTIKNYEGVSAAIISGDTNKISKSLEMYRNDFKTTETATKESLEAQYKKLDEEYKLMEQAVKSGSKDITAADLAEKKYWRDQALVEYSKATQDARDAAKAAASGYADRMKAGKDGVKKAAAEVAGGATTVLDAEVSNAKKSGTNFSDGFINGILARKEAAKSAGRQLGGAASDALNNRLLERSPSRLTMKSGEYFAEGFAIGIDKASRDAILAAQSLGSDAAGAVNSEARMSVAAANPYIDRNISLVDAFKVALSGMRIDLDDHEVGAFVEATVANAVYAR